MAVNLSIADVKAGAGARRANDMFQHGPSQLRSVLLAGLTSAALSLAALSGHAATLDLTGPKSITGGSGSSTTFGTINGASFEVGSLHPTGTGVFDPFLTIQNKGVEEGYNTSGSPVQFDEKRQPNWTRPLLLSSLQVVTNPYTGQSAYEFMLDLNEVATAKGLISLDTIQIYQAGAGNYTHLDLATRKFTDPGATSALVYDMNPVGSSTTNTVLLNYNVIGKGQGSSDLNVYIPTALFNNAALPYIYLYTKLGGYGADFCADAGYEEWRAIEGASPPVPGPLPAPTPSAAAAGVCLLLGLAPIRRNRRQSNPA